MKTILVINGSASAHSSNGRLIELLRRNMEREAKTSGDDHLYRQASGYHYGIR